MDGSTFLTIGLLGTVIVWAYTQFEGSAEPAKKMQDEIDSFYRNDL